MRLWPWMTRIAGGILRGKVTEIFGPPGAGKTSLALNVASHALRDGGKVVWIDTGPPLPTPRLTSIPEEDLQKIIYFRAPTLPHLLALLMRPPTNFPPEGTTLIVIDSVSSHFPVYFPNAADLKEQLSTGKLSDKAQLQWLLNRKWNVASDLATHLFRLATSRHTSSNANANANGIAILAINQAHTKIKNQPRATLHPILSGGAWEPTIHTRLVVYRDLPDARFVEITKKAGRTLTVRVPEMIVSFSVGEGGVDEIGPEEEVLRQSQSPILPRVEIDTPSRKRKAEDEIADSQDEDSEAEFQWDELLDEGEGEGEAEHKDQGQVQDQVQDQVQEDEDTASQA
ncbi:hypothetical protein N7509_001304 [Penicillium cosmopolitanum]|uniref:DNA repair protein RAD51 homolog 3 n=1 Tax=Penicillium cosmopolitanum TaxID=1131564 RepID=A0A9X0BEX6_9EURO|nr:uncharacterized protein N7509_001304 [Penicillium cosmopolitanum]KAJ5414677.1 hypothetical protein N7509_001304 [Penicillium cosmopolitanum]